MMTFLCASQVKNEKMSKAFVLGEAVLCASRHEDVLLCDDERKILLALILLKQLRFMTLL